MTYDFVVQSWIVTGVAAAVVSCPTFFVLKKISLSILTLRILCTLLLILGLYISQLQASPSGDSWTPAIIFGCVNGVIWTPLWVLITLDHRQWFFLSILAGAAFILMGTIAAFVNFEGSGFRSPQMKIASAMIDIAVGVILFFIGVVGLRKDRNLEPNQKTDIAS